MSRSTTERSYWATPWTAPVVSGCVISARWPHVTSAGSPSVVADRLDFVSLLQSAWSGGLLIASLAMREDLSSAGWPGENAARCTGKLTVHLLTAAAADNSKADMSLSRAASLHSHLAVPDCRLSSTPGAVNGTYRHFPSSPYSGPALGFADCLWCTQRAAWRISC